MRLHELKAPLGARKRRKIVGRGPSSGHGKTSGRGTKGQNARSGRGILPGLEGGQVPLIRRIPKIGFRNQSRVEYQIVNVRDLNIFDNGTVITREVLKSKNLIKSLNEPVKVLGDGEVKKSLIVQIPKISEPAKEKILKAGGKIEPDHLKNDH